MNPIAAIRRTRLIRDTEGSVPVVVAALSGGHEINRRVETEAEALEAGVDVYCELPQDSEVLPHRLYALLRRTSGIFPCGASQFVSLSEESRQLHVDKVWLRLSQREYALVHRLDQQRNQWVPTDVLWSVISERDRPYDSSLLRMHVLRIRKGLGPARWALRTERGKGVMLTDVPPSSLG